MSAQKRPDGSADMPPLPRDHGSSLMSEVVPLRSTTVKFWKSKLLIPGLLAVAATVLMFQQLFGEMTTTTALIFAVIIGLFLLFTIFAALYFYTGSRKPLWAFSLPFIFTTAAITTPFVMITFYPIAVLFRQVLPGSQPNPPTPDFLPNFISMFFGAGMAEELLKILPVLIMVGIGLKLRSQHVAPNKGFLGALGALTPLDCMLAGAASGAGFILGETFGEYYGKTFAGMTAQSQNAALGALTALQLSIPRVLGGVVGHMGWSAIFGYFVGLGIRRSTLAAPLFVGAWLLVSVMHGFWNSGVHLMGFVAYWVSGLTTLPVLLACLLMARKIEDLTYPTLAQGSIVVGAGGPMAYKPAADSRSFGYSAPAGFSAVGTGRPATMSAAPPVPAGAASTGYALEVGGVVVPLMRGQTLNLGTTPGLERIGQGFFAEVSSHPSNPAIIGLKNIGPMPWLLTASNGQTQQVPTTRSARLEPGGRILFGEVAISVIAHR